MIRRYCEYTGCVERASWLRKHKKPNGDATKTAYCGGHRSRLLTDKWGDVVEQDFIEIESVESKSTA